MKVLNIKYRDTLRARQRRSLVLKITLVSIGIILILSGIIYWLFFTSHFQITGVSINGLKTLDSQKVNAEVDLMRKKRFLGLKTGNNILFFNSNNLSLRLLNDFPELRDVSIKKKYFHSLDLNLTERDPIVIWCFSPPAGGCHYFDNNKIIWGDSAKSSGFLFITIEDQRSGIKAIDGNFFDGIMKVLNNSSQSKFKIQSIIIPDGSFDQFKVYTDKSYYLIFSLNSDIPSQMQVLDIFLNEKSKDSNFNPQYLDLRIDGRVYYK